VLALSTVTRMPYSDARMGRYGAVGLRLFRASSAEEAPVPRPQSHASPRKVDCGRVFRRRVPEVVDDPEYRRTYWIRGRRSRSHVLNQHLGVEKIGPDALSARHRALRSVPRQDRVTRGVRVIHRPLPIARKITSPR
jgi:hypothetical protein